VTNPHKNTGGLESDRSDFSDLFGTRDLDQLLADLLEAAKDDVGAVFEPDGIEILHAVREDPAAWARTRGKLKSLKVPLRDLDRLLREFHQVMLEDQEIADGGGGGQSRPTILIRPNATAVLNEATEALLACSQVEVYQRGGVLVRLARGVGTRPTIQAVPLNNLFELMAKSASWKRIGKEGPISVLPPKWAYQMLYARIPRRFPRLEGVVEAPTLRADGSVLQNAGYDQTSGLIYEPGSERVPQVPEEPTLTEARAAVELLGQPIQDFPFLEASDRSAALALILSLLAKQAICGPIPMFLVVAPTPATGKTLLARVASLIATGRSIPASDLPASVDEQRKFLLALGLEGAPLVLLDNIECDFASRVLCQALTSGTIKGRVLGVSRTAEVPVPLVVGTGNNVSPKGDLVRRVLPIGLDPRVERPEERTGFAIQDLERWVRTNRPRLVVAGLTILRGFCHAGRPQPRVGLPAWGSYEAWSDLVRGALVWAGQPDPWLGRRRIRDEPDPDLEVLGSLLRCWHRRYGGQAKLLKEVVTDVEGSLNMATREFRQALVAMTPKADGSLSAAEVSYGLRRHRGRILNGLCLESNKTREGHRWRVDQIEKPA
jgi:hypothetical protein